MKQRRKHKQGKKRLMIPRVIESFYPVMSGPANQASRISKELESLGVSSPILTSDHGAEGRKKKENMDGVNVFRFPAKWKFMKYFYTPSMKKALEDLDADVICAHSFRSYQTEIAYKTARRIGKPFILHNHGSLVGYKTFVKGIRRLPYTLYDLLHKNIALDADAVIVNTKQELGEVLRYGVSRKQIHLIPVGIGVSDYKPLRRTWKETRLLFVGRICRDRNVGPVIKATKMLVDRGLNVNLTIVGGSVKRSDAETGDYLGELRALVKRIGLSDRVKFTGAKYGKELRQYYKSSDIFIYPSLWENFGQTILEAAAAGLPLVCTRVGVALDLVKHGKTGWFVGDDDATGIAKGVVAMKRKLGKKTSDRIIKNVKDGYEWKRIILQYKSIYNKLLNKYKNS